MKVTSAAAAVSAQQSQNSVISINIEKPRFIRTSCAAELATEQPEILILLHTISMTHLETISKNIAQSAVVYKNTYLVENGCLAVMFLYEK